MTDLERWIKLKEEIEKLRAEHLAKSQDLNLCMSTNKTHIERMRRYDKILAIMFKLEQK